MPQEMIDGGKRKAMKSAAMKVEGDFAKMEKVIVTGTTSVILGSSVSQRGNCSRG